jgi:hypothetical protein
MVSALLFGKIRKCGQRVAPHGIEVGTQLRQTFGIEVKVVAGAPPFFFHQTDRLQHLQVLGDSGTAYGKLAGQFADRGGLPPQQVEDGLAGRVRERPQHLPSVSHALP